MPRTSPPKTRRLGRSQVLQRLIDDTPGARYLSIDIQSGHCYAISVINDQLDEIDVLEGEDLPDSLSSAGERVCRGLDNGAYPWPGAVEVQNGS